MSQFSSGDVNSKLEALRLKFCRKAESDFDTLDQVAEILQAGEVNSDLLSEAYRTLHRLAGSAGTFGFLPLGEKARVLELKIKPFIDVPSSHLNFATLGEDFCRDLKGLGLLMDVGETSNIWPEPQIKQAISDQSVILLIEPDKTVGRGLVNGLELYGYQPLWLSSLEEWADKAEPPPSAVIIRDELLINASNDLLGFKNECPIVCIGVSDCHERRYSLAERGAEAFFSEPLNLPVLADHLERLISDNADASSGRVLIVDDDRELSEHYRLVLANAGMEVRTVPGDPSFLPSVLSAFRPDIVLMDVQMGHVSGPVLARMLRFEPELLSLPIIYLSAEEDRELQLDALAKGGDDFLTKPVSDSFLLRTVRVRCHRAMQLNKLVSRDSLTGLLKHSLVKTEIAHEHSRCLRLGHNSVVAMLDLDHFKLVNDTHGHRAGDFVIKGLANLLRHRLRETDIIGRYGGEEFIVALPECTMELAQSILESVCRDFSCIEFKGSGGDFRVTMSVGLASLPGYESSEDAIEAADSALYKRKDSGRNGVTSASP